MQVYSIGTGPIGTNTYLAYNISIRIVRRFPHESTYQLIEAGEYYNEKNDNNKHNSTFTDDIMCKQHC